MSLYPVAGQPLLSEAAKALGGQELAAMAQMAEDALGLTGTAYTDTQAARATLAVVRQVNRMLSEPDNPFLSSHTRGEETKSWSRPGTGTRDADILDPIAVKIVEQLAAEAAGEEVGGYVTLRSLR